MDNQDQEYGGGGARKEGEMDGRRRNNVGGITISDETTAAEEEAVHGGASGSNRSGGGTINQDGIIDLTGSPPETAGSNRAVSEDDGRTLNLIESLPEKTAEEEAVHGGVSGSNRSSGGTINQDGIVDLTGSPPETAGSSRAVSEDDGRTLNLIESLPETMAEEEAVHGGASGSNRSSGGTINQDGIVDLTGSPPETAGSNRAVSVDDGRTLNLIESLPETTAGGRLDSVGNPGSAFTPAAMSSPINRESSSSRLSLRPLHVQISHLIKGLQDSARRRAGGGGYNSTKAAAPPEPPENRRQLGKGKGKAAAVDQHSFIPNYFPPLDGHEDQPPFKKLNIGGGGGGYCQTSGGVGGSRYIQYSGVSGGSSHNNSTHQLLLHGGEASAPAATAAAALPPRPSRPPRPPPPDDYVCMYCNWARFRSRQALEEHMIPCSLLFLKGG
ncbi:hypothetical protein ABFX02_08G162700 [Erythranthe guttata]